MGNTSLKHSCIQYTIRRNDRFGGDEVFANALENRLTILSSAPTIQKQTGNATHS